MSERKKIQIKISKQKYKIQFLAYLPKLTKNHLIGQIVILAIKILAFSK